MDKQQAFNKIKETSEAVNKAGGDLENIINKTALSLDNDLNYGFPIDSSTEYLFKDIHAKLNIWPRKTTLETRIWVPANPATGAVATGIYAEIDTKESTKVGFVSSKTAAQGTMNVNRNMKNAGEITAYNTAQTDYNNAELALQKIDREIQELRNELQQKQSELKGLKNFDAGGIFEWSVTARRNEVQQIKDAKDIFNTVNEIDHQVLNIGGAMASVDLDTKFNGGTAWAKDYMFYDDKQKKRIRPGEPLVVSAKNASGNEVQVTLKWVQISGTPLALSITNLQVEWDVTDTPINIHDLYVRAVHLNASGRSFYHDKKLWLTINNPIKNFNLTERSTKLGEVEGNLTSAFVQARLRQEFETKFNKLQREAFEKALSTNPEFAKLNQAQKDRLYQRMQEVWTISTWAVNVKLGDNIPPATGPFEYPISEILFAPSTHSYSIMPYGEDYNGFSLWLANQAPKDVLAKDDKYKEWLTNGLVASVDNGKTHYENFFADVLQKFTDDVNVKTTLNQTLLEFINDTNTADHMAFDADLAAALTSTEPVTTYSKRWYQRLAFWKQGEAQNYLSFFQGQSEEFKTESISVGWKKIDYTGKLEIQSAQSVIMHLKMKDGNEQIHKSWSPVWLVRELLRSPDIEPPHARFHAGLSVVKSMTKLARGNGISLRSALTPAMLDTLPIAVRTTLAAWDNPMVEIEEVNGKLVAKVFNLNLTTRQKENEYKMFDEQDFVATQSVRDLRQWVESLLSLTNHVLNDTYTGYREARRGSGLRRALLKKNRYGGLMNFWKTISFEGQSISVWGKNVILTCKDGLFTFTGDGLEKPISGRNLGDLLAYNPALRGVELKALHIANENMIETYQEKLAKKDRMKNYGVIDEVNHRVYIMDKDGNLWYVDNASQEFVGRWRQYTSWHSYGRIKDGDMPTGFRVMKKGKTVVDKETYENFLRNESLVWPMVRAMSRTHRAVTTWAPWD